MQAFATRRSKVAYGQIYLSIKQNILKAWDYKVSSLLIVIFSLYTGILFSNIDQYRSAWGTIYAR